MQVVSDRNELREVLGDWRRAGDHIALVPTMGNLHEGHLSLLALAREHAERLVVTVFVNPTQFGEGEDYEDYPRTQARDERHVKRANADLLFVPSVETIYPFGTDAATSVTVPVLTEDFCGLQRPGHFDGVTTVVSRLFSLVQPDVAVFGQKDYQQVTLVRRMVRDLDFPVRIRTAPILREEDGLALSSRNVYLSERDRVRARSLSEGLFAARTAFDDEGMRDADRLKARVRGTMRDGAVEPEYIELVDPDTLTPLEEARNGAVLAVAARVGQTRLIDNVILGQAE